MSLVVSNEVCLQADATHKHVEILSEPARVLPRVLERGHGYLPTVMPAIAKVCSNPHTSAIRGIPVSLSTSGRNLISPRARKILT